MAIAPASQLTVEPGENRGKSFHDGGLGVLFKIFGSETGGALAVVEHPIDPHRLVPPHTHSDVDEYSYVIEGEIGARIGDQVISAGPGTYVLKPGASCTPSGTRPTGRPASSRSSRRRSSKTSSWRWAT